MHPETSITGREIDELNFHVSMEYARLLYLTDRGTEAQPYVDYLEGILSEIPVVGWADNAMQGHDIGLYAAMGEREKMIAAIRNRRNAGALDDMSQWFESFPSFAAYEHDPEVIEIKREMDAALGKQRQRIREMESKGELAPIPEIANETPREHK